MADDYRFECDWSEAVRAEAAKRFEYALSRSTAVPPVRAVVRSLAEQIAEGVRWIRLSQGHLTLAGRVQVAQSLRNAFGGGQGACLTCFQGEVRVPRELGRLSDDYERRNTLDMLPAVWAECLGKPADLETERRLAAERQAALEAERDALYRLERGSHGRTLPTGAVVPPDRWPDGDGFEPAASVADFLPRR